MDRKTIDDFLASVERELTGNILPFWLERSVDRDRGGFVGQRSNDLQVIPDAPKGLILNARLLWTFSALHRFDENRRCLDLARRAYDYLNEYFWDREFGGAFWQVDCFGQRLDGTKKIYGQAFYVYALAEYFQTTRNQDALDRAVELFRLIERHSRDTKHGGYVETCNRDWTLADDSRLSDKDMDEKKSMNNHLHVLEAYTSLYRVWKDETLARRLEELIQIFQQRIFDPETFHFHHFFDECWERKSSTYTFGHDIEGSWLLDEAAEALDNERLLNDVRKTAVQLAQAARDEGIDDEYGGLFYEGKEGAIVDSNKEWWPQAEAVVGFLNAYWLSGDESFFEAALNCWMFIEKFIVDPTYGEWFWRVSRDGGPDWDQPKLSEWKSAYHNSRACMEAIRRLQMIAQGV